MYFLCRDDVQTYLTVHKEDMQYFQDIINSDYFGKENKFRVIRDKAEIKKILEDRYSSKNRGSEYTSGLPSATLISSALFPYNLDPHAQHNSTALLKWHNNIDVADLQNQKITNKLSTDSGTFIHKILELALMDRKTRIFDKSRGLNKYIELALLDNEIISMIDNFEDRKDYFKQMAQKTLKLFFEKELPNIDPVFNELFVVNKGIQGAVDLVDYKDGKLFISDFKTSKKSMSRNQVEGKGYLRQLYIYSRVLLNLGIISKKEYNNLSFKIHFFNWNSGNSATYEFDKKEVDKSQAYCEFILQWYYDMKDMNVKVSEVL